MPFVPDPGKGRLFDNKIDRTKDTQPDYTGTASCPCCKSMVRLSGWYNPPSERQRVSTIGLQLEDYAEYRARVDAKKKASQDVDPNDHAPAIPPEDRPAGTYQDKPAYGDDTDFNDDIPF